MRIIDCDPAEIRLRLPPCAHALTAATLTGPGEPITLVATVEPIDPLDPDARLVTLTGIPLTTPRGVWTLNLTSDCGCWYTNVYVNMCPRPQMLSEHVPTPGAGGPSIECCLPNADSAWSPLPADFVFDVTLVDDAYVLTQRAPLPPATTVSYVALTGNFVFTGVPNTVALIELLDENGIVLASTTTSRTELAFAATRLKCKTYWLRFSQAAA